jgi:hypothetical protein
MLAFAVEAEKFIAASSTFLLRAVMLALQDCSFVVLTHDACASNTATAKGVPRLLRNTLSRGNLALDIMHGLAAASQV